MDKDFNEKRIAGSLKYGLIVDSYKSLVTLAIVAVAFVRWAA